MLVSASFSFMLLSFSELKQISFDCFVEDPLKSDFIFVNPAEESAETLWSTLCNFFNRKEGIGYEN